MSTQSHEQLPAISCSAWAAMLGELGNSSAATNVVMSDGESFVKRICYNATEIRFIPIEEMGSNWKKMGIDQIISLTKSFLKTLSAAELSRVKSGFGCLLDNVKAKQADDNAKFAPVVQRIETFISSFKPFAKERSLEDTLRKMREEIKTIAGLLLTIRSAPHDKKDKGLSKKKPFDFTNSKIEQALQKLESELKECAFKGEEVPPQKLDQADSYLKVLTLAKKQAEQLQTWSTSGDPQKAYDAICVVVVAIENNLADCGDPEINLAEKNASSDRFFQFMYKTLENNQKSAEIERGKEFLTTLFLQMYSLLGSISNPELALLMRRKLDEFHEVFEEIEERSTDYIEDRSRALALDALRLRISDLKTEMAPLCDLLKLSSDLGFEKQAHPFVKKELEKMIALFAQQLALLEPLCAELKIPFFSGFLEVQQKLVSALRKKVEQLNTGQIATEHNRFVSNLEDVVQWKTTTSKIIEAKNYVPTLDTKDDFENTRLEEIIAALDKLLVDPEKCYRHFETVFFDVKNKIKRRRLAKQVGEGRREAEKAAAEAEAKRKAGHTTDFWENPLSESMQDTRKRFLEIIGHLEPSKPLSKKALNKAKNRWAVKNHPDKSKEPGANELWIEAMKFFEELMQFLRNDDDVI